MEGPPVLAGLSRLSLCLSLPPLSVFPLKIKLLSETSDFFYYHPGSPPHFGVFSWSPIMSRETGVETHRLQEGFQDYLLSLGCICHPFPEPLQHVGLQHLLLQAQVNKPLSHSL